MCVYTHICTHTHTHTHTYIAQQVYRERFRVKIMLYFLFRRWNDLSQDWIRDLGGLNVPLVSLLAQPPLQVPCYRLLFESLVRLYLKSFKVCAVENVKWSVYFSASVQFSSVTQSCPTFCDPINCSTPGLAVHHQLPEFTQTHFHPVGDAIQPSHPLSSPFPPAPNPSQHQSLFQWVNSSHEVAKVLEFQL